MTVSVIIPAWNEVRVLPGLLADLARQEGVRLEILVADGGSSDATRLLAAEGGAGVLTCPARGRAAQMNHAASFATGELLLFLHADTRLPDPWMVARAVETLQDHCQKSGHERVAGHFALRFRRARSGHGLAFAYMEAKSRQNRPGAIHGDQGFLLSRGFFRFLGGFEERFLEDDRLVARVWAVGGAWRLLPGEVVTSARRFEEEGVTRRIWLNAAILAAHGAGWEAFLERAPGLYRHQGGTGLLRLLPFLRLLGELDAGEAWPVRRARWRRMGAVFNRESWQLFLFPEVVWAWLGGRSARGRLVVHDRLFRPLCDRPFFDIMLGVLTFLFFRLAVVWAGKGDQGRA